MQLKRLTLTAFFVALCVTGGLIKIPSGIGSLALDTVPALLSAAFLPPVFSGIAAMLGHMASAMYAGFPLGPFHVLIALEMFVIVIIFARLHKAGRNLTKWIFFIVANGIIAPLPFYFLISPAFFLSAIPFLFLATIVNAVVAAVVMPSLQHVGTSMRNAIDIGNGFIVTTDNSGGIGEKPRDIVAVPDRVTAHFAARVALLEQWAAHAEPVSILIHNFSGSTSWENYVAGVTDLFHEAGLDVPEINGSSETNMELVQSAMAVTMIGKKTEELALENSAWFTYGTPLVGDEVRNRVDEIASLALIHEAMKSGIVHQIWPVGSSGILQEVRLLTGNKEVRVETVLDSMKSAGPSTVVLLAISETEIKKAEALFGVHLNKLTINT